jgi:predicted nucleotidyltransferase
LTQQQLGERAGVTQSVVSAYERGRREPSLAMLQKLVEAAGARLVIGVDTPHGSLLDRVRAKRDVLAPALGTLGARDIRVFGSAARGDEGPTSDVDLLVTLDAPVGLFALGRMRSVAEAILGRPVDVGPDDGLKDHLRATILREAVPL